MLVTRSKTFPLPSSQGLEIDFLENRPSDFQKPGKECVFDADKRQFVPRNSTLKFRDTIFQDDSSKGNQIELQHTKDSLQAAIQTLKEKKGDKDNSIAEFDLTKARTWEDVVVAVKAAEESYLRDEGPTGKIRKVFRKVEDKAKSMQPFLGLLPDGEYKILCGGLTLILKAMMKKSERRQKMADLLERLPVAVQNAEDYAHIYPGKNSLRSCIEELYIQIIGAIEDMIRWYLQKSPKRAVRAVFNNDAYGQKLTTRISDIDAAQAVFKAETEIYLHWRARLIEHHVVETNMTTQQMDLNLKRIGNTLYTEIQKAQLETQRSIAVVGSRVMNHVSSVLNEYRKTADWFQERDSFKKELVDKEKELVDKDDRIRDLERQLLQKCFHASTLARRLHISLPPDSYSSDVDQSLAYGITQRTRFQAMTKHIAETEEFRKWFTTKESSVLCINGNSEQDPTSPTAFLASLIVQDLKPRSRDVLVLPFFCGLHTNAMEMGEHQVAGPTLMLRTFLAQMLSLEHIDKHRHLIFLGEDEVEAMESMQTKAYLDTIAKLLKNLSHDYKGIFIIIDGIEYYAKDAHMSRLRRTVKLLARLTSEFDSSSATLKVLLMAASQCSLFRRSSGYDFNTLEIPENVDCDGEEYENLGEM